MTNPNIEIINPFICTRVTLSLNTKTAKKMVKKTYDCNNSDAKPDVKCPSNDKNKKLNLNMPKKMPIPNTASQCFLGNGIKRMAGIATIKKRNPENKKGGSCVNPSLITTKLSPQSKITNKAKNKSVSDNFINYQLSSRNYINFNKPGRIYQP